MTRKITLTGILLLLGCLPGRASIIGPWITLMPPDGVVAGVPGTSVGWGFTIHGDETNWITITRVLIAGETSAVGVFIDYAGNNGGNTDFAVAPGTDWIDVFTVGSPFGTGLGEYQIDAGTLPGPQDTGSFQILYDVYADDPVTCSCGPITTGLELFAPHDSNDPGPLSQVSFAIDITDSTPEATPEPATWAILGTGLALIAVGKARLRKTAPNQGPDYPEHFPAAKALYPDRTGLENVPLQN